jgi:hypothetical protein
MGLTAGKEEEIRLERKPNENSKYQNLHPQWTLYGHCSSTKHHLFLGVPSA